MLVLYTCAVATLAALIRSVQYSIALAITPKECVRYLKKSVSFALCYAGVARVRQTNQSWKAGEVAFLCCAYDVVTDWRNFDPESWQIFRRILTARTSDAKAQALAFDLYDKERFHTLMDDGLERGAIALRFALQMIRSDSAGLGALADVDEVGRLLQIVDDVLDYEDDIRRGEMNCLTSGNKWVYLQRLVHELDADRVKQLFGDQKTVLTAVVDKARSKAELMLSTLPLTSERVAVSDASHETMPNRAVD